MHLNTIFGKTVIDQLVKQGVSYFVLAPGSRCSPLAIAAFEDERVETLIHFDERGAAFHALGYAKATGGPAAVIVTSGTAAGNLMPAVMEASAAHLPLILLTADKPHKLRDAGANQTTDQIKLFGDFVRYQFDFPCPSSSLPPRFLATTLAQGILKSQFPLPGPVQFNLPFPKPLLAEAPQKAIEMDKVALHLPHIASDQTIDVGSKRGVIVLGAQATSQQASALARRLNWPIFADIISGHREKVDPRSIAHYHHILQASPDLAADVVVHVGGPCVSQVLQEWMAQQPELIHVSPFTTRIDPLHAVSTRLFCCSAIDGIPSSPGWLNQWKALEATLSFELGAFSEPAIIRSLEACGSALFFANSMPIRDADMFFFPTSPLPPLFANRGLSGIDGNIATVCGIASTMPVTAVIGDQSFLHDLNSLAQVSKVKHPPRFIIINNGGGGIFSFVAGSLDKSLLDSHFAAAHTMTFEGIADAFGLSYAHVDSLDALHASNAQVIEVTTNREENYRLHNAIDHQALARISYANEVRSQTVMADND